MKTTISIALLINIFLLNSCNNVKQDDQNKSDANSTNITVSKPAVSSDANTDTTAAAFDISKLPESTTDLGVFPYFDLPSGYVYTAPNKNCHGEGSFLDFDREYFLVDGVYYPQEGRAFKASICLDRNHEKKQFNELEVIKNFDQFMEQLGGTKVNNGKKPNIGEKDKIDQEESRSGYLHSSGNFPSHTYVIRQAESEIWVQFYLSRLNKSGGITILQKGELKNTMKLITSDEISDDLLDKGKSVLHINFDIDKATLTNEGELLVEEIAKSLKQHPEMIIEIQGHTDNTGDISHNKTLSSNRAKTVLDELVTLGIDQNRLTATGFGSEHPIADNATNEGKAKNRRVELIKK